MLSLLNRVRERAAVSVLRAEAKLFDLRHGTDTGGRIPVEHLDVRADGATAYQSVSARHFHSAMQAIDFPPDSVFIDFGAGKGKSLLLASDYENISGLIGVEMSPLLCAAARLNIAHWQQAKAQSKNFTALNEDARAYKFLGDENLIFLYNPFDASVLEVVMDNLVASLKSGPRNAWIIYCNPVHEQVIEDKGFKIAHKFRPWTPGRDIYVYNTSVK